jgi:hypothetical protein
LICIKELHLIFDLNECEEIIHLISKQLRYGSEKIQINICDFIDDTILAHIADIVHALVYITAHSSNECVKEKATYVLGNISGNCHKDSDCVLSCGALEHLVRNLNVSDELSFLKVGACTLSKLIYRENIKNDDIEDLFSALGRLLHLDRDIASKACDILFDLTKNDFFTQVLIKDKIILCRLIGLLRHPDDQILIKVVKIIGNIFSNDESFVTQSLIDLGALPYIFRLIKESKNTEIVCECTWNISNVAAGDQNQIEEVISGGFFEVFCEIYKSDSDKDVKKNIFYSVTNVFFEGCEDQVIRIINIGCFDVIVDFVVQSQDKKTISEFLDAFKKKIVRDKYLSVIK